MSIAKFSGNGIMSVFPGIEHGFASTTIFFRGGEKNPNTQLLFFKHKYMKIIKSFVIISNMRTLFR